MPKETISSSEEQSLELRWGKDQQFGQIGIVFDKWFSFHEDWEMQEIPEYNSLWFDFSTREEYNRAIRALKKMRDKHFGKDE
jgi:hypothetical protein